MTDKDIDAVTPEHSTQAPRLVNLLPAINTELQAFIESQAREAWQRQVSEQATRWAEVFGQQFVRMGMRPATGELRHSLHSLHYGTPQSSAHWTHHDVSDDSYTERFDLEPTEHCWREDCGVTSDPKSETGLCSEHLAAMKDRWKR